MFIRTLTRAEAINSRFVREIRSRKSVERPGYWDTFAVTDEGHEYMIPHDELNQLTDRRVPNSNLNLMLLVAWDWDGEGPVHVNEMPIVAWRTDAESSEPVSVDNYMDSSAAWVIYERSTGHWWAPADADYLTEQTAIEYLQKRTEEYRATKARAAARANAATQ